MTDSPHPSWEWFRLLLGVICLWGGLSLLITAIWFPNKLSGGRGNLFDPKDRYIRPYALIAGIVMLFMAIGEFVLAVRH